MSSPILERPAAPEANAPGCVIYDALEMGQSAALAAATARDSLVLNMTGFRRYRLKVVQLTGGTSTDVSILDVPFSRVIANAYETVLLGTPLVTVRTVFNFGEGTAIFSNFMGTWLVVRLLNNDALLAATYEIELFAQR